jgi:hypothetical protein
MLFTVSVVSEVQAQSPTAAKLKLEKLGEEEAIPSILIDDKITITTIVISKETGVNIGEDIFLSDITFNSSSKPILTIFAVFI